MNDTLPAKSSPPLLSQLWKQFSSMKFAIILLLIIAVVSVAALFLGEFYPVRASGPGWQEFWQKELHLSKPVFAILTFLELHDPYRSWWYQILLVLLSVSLFACILDRLPKVLRLMRPSQSRSVEELAGMSLYRTLSIPGTPEEAKRRLPRLFRYIERRENDELKVAGSHGLIASFGPILAHSGLLAIVLGGLAASVGGFNTRVAGVPGDIMTDPGFDFAVRVDSFNIEYYPLQLGQWVLVDDQVMGKIVSKEKGDRFRVEMRGHGDETQTTTVAGSRIRNQFDIEMDRGNISDYVSVLTVLDQDREVLHKRIEVNKPLRYKGFRFYQASFDPEHPSVKATVDSVEIVLHRATDDAVLDTVYIKSSEPLTLPDGAQLHLGRFLPDFRLDGGQATTASATLRNPAVLLEVRRGEQELYHQWAFLKMDFPHTAEGAVYRFQALKLEGFQASLSYPTILEVNKNPGGWLIYLGFILCTIGLIVAFYLVPQRLWAVLRQKEGGRCEVHLAGISTKSPDLFERKFAGWVERLKRGK